MTTPTNPSTDIESQVSALAAATGLDEASVRLLLTAQDQRQGEPIGTLRHDGAGAVAHRVMDGDVPKWRVSHPTEGMTYEMAPTKSDWLLIAPPTGS